MKRRIVQILAAVSTNHYVVGFLQATIYKGKLKHICHPGMQCYSCPSSNVACPLGALQNSFAVIRDSIAKRHFNIGLYVIGYLGILGMLFGRLICGWVCPFGLLQDLLYKIPTLKFKLPRFASFGRYAFLVILVILLPLCLSLFTESGTTYPWYCKIVCPVGTFEAGIPKILQEPSIRASLGLFFRIKWIVLIIFLFLIVLSRRAFCVAGCPLGAIYGLFNKISLYRLSVNKEQCNNCWKCERACPMHINVCDSPNHPDCIRCLECISACPSGAIYQGFLHNGILTAR